MSNLERTPVETGCGGDVAVAERLDVLAGRGVPLGRYTTVSRLLPHTNRRMVGAWCFVDHFGPDAVGEGPGMRVPPHPHCGLQTVTWLLAGEILHRDSLGNRAMIRPGQLNLMSGAHGIAHAEESPEGHSPALHGLQLWIALPIARADGEARFEHHPELPSVRIDDAYATVVIGTLDGHTSPALVHTPMVGADLRMEAGTRAGIPLRTNWEHAILVTAGTADVEGVALAPGTLLYLGLGRRTLSISSGTGARLFLLGGKPFTDELVMWWNFVARSHEEIVRARDDWAAGRRFGIVRGYDGDALPAPEMPITRLKPRDRHGRPLP